MGEEVEVSASRRHLEADARSGVGLAKKDPVAKHAVDEIDGCVVEKHDVDAPAEGLREAIRQIEVAPGESPRRAMAEEQSQVEVAASPAVPRAALPKR